jgi:hypothetical protein
VGAIREAALNTLRLRQMGLDYFMEISGTIFVLLSISLGVPPKKSLSCMGHWHCALLVAALISL